MNTYNEMKLEFSSYSENESFARTVVSAFIARMDPTLEELADVKTAVSEAVTNAIIHGYEKNPGMVTIYGKIEENTIYLEISDTGEGISDITKAMEPLYTSKPELDRSGMGFAFMRLLRTAQRLGLRCVRQNHATQPQGGQVPMDTRFTPYWRHIRALS